MAVTTHNDTSYVQTTSSTSNGIDILAGVWLILAPFILSFSGLATATWNNIIVGAVVVVLAIISLASTRSTASRWLNALAGAWLFFSPFILGYSTASRALWNDLILGAIIAIVSIWSANALSNANNDRELSA
jgi:hypothetical protein